MTTEIKLQGANLQRLLEKHGNAGMQGDEFSIGSFPDKRGIYLTPFGEVGLDFLLTHKRQTREVVLECGEETLLRNAAYKSIIRVQINKEGNGLAQLKRGFTVFVHTDALNFGKDTE